MSTNLAPYITLFLITTLYACILAWMKRNERWDYEPDWTDMTVVIGNTILGLHIWWILGWEMFLIVLKVNIVGGVPILVWRAIERFLRRRARKEYTRVAPDAKR
jgi:uncharacterized membrane protein